jgi:hypothetical protein
MNHHCPGTEVLKGGVGLHWQPFVRVANYFHEYLRCRRNGVSIGYGGITKTVENLKEKMMFEKLIRCKWLGDGCNSLEEIAVRLEEEAAYLREMARNGLQLEEGMQDDYALLKTEDPALAEKYGFDEIEEDEE